jgi:hypothetical protein
MDADGFWEIIDRASSPDALQRELATLPNSELADFEVEHAKAYAATYDWGLWGAAYVIAGGCSDDSFDYFRSYVIGLGRRVYEAALANPDSLADVDVDDGEEWEDWMSPTLAIVEERTGKYERIAAERHPAQPGEPTGDDWEEEPDELAARFPRLWAKHGDA